jgi:hypothetical protein
MNPLFQIDSGRQREEEIARTLRLLHAPGQVFEIRATRVPGRGTVSGYFTDALLAAWAVGAVDGVVNVEVTLNPVSPGLLMRATNALRDHADTTTSDAEIARRRWLPLLFTPRPIRQAFGAPVPDADAEWQSALQVALTLSRTLTAQGWPLPLVAMAANDIDLLYPADVPNDAASHALIERVLQALAQQVDAEVVTLDANVGTAATLVPLFGTLHWAGRATRRSALLVVPPALTDPATRPVVTPEQLSALLEQHDAEGGR